MRSDDLPDDPFDVELPDFSNFEGPHAEDILRFVREFADAQLDYSALRQQQSLRELGAAVYALDDKRARAALLRAIATSICHHMHDPERFARWVEAQ